MKNKFRIIEDKPLKAISINNQQILTNKSTTIELKFDQNVSRMQKFYVLKNMSEKIILGCDFIVNKIDNIDFKKRKINMDGTMIDLVDIERKEIDMLDEILIGQANKCKTEDDINDEEKKFIESYKTYKENNNTFKFIKEEKVVLESRKEFIAPKYKRYSVPHQLLIR